LNIEEDWCNDRAEPLWTQTEKAECTMDLCADKTAFPGVESYRTFLYESAKPRNDCLVPADVPEPVPLSESSTVHVGILLSTFNGARYLASQLESFAAQTVREWRLYWRDDGSDDQSVALVRTFAEGAGAGRCAEVPVPGHLGAMGSYMVLLREAVPSGLPLAFADQDDVWLPNKLEMALGTLAAHPGPALYCSRQLLVDELLAPFGESFRLRREPGLLQGLTQNIATGCTIVLSSAGAGLVAQSRPPDSSLHDWWSYLMIAGSGGHVIADPRPTVLYRQHGGNLVGAPHSMRLRARAALRRGRTRFITLLRAHVAALLDHADLLSAETREKLDIIDRGLTGGLSARLTALRLPGFHRQTWQETLLFRCWFLLGKAWCTDTVGLGAEELGGVGGQPS
jgi:hypothetical protein